MRKLNRDGEWSKAARRHQPSSEMIFMSLSGQTESGPTEVSYTFDVGKQSFSGTCQIAHRPTSPKATVVYDPENPLMNQLHGTAIPPMPQSRWSLGTLFLLVSIPIILLAVAVAVSQSLKRSETALDETTFWSHPASFFFTPRGKSVSTVGGTLVGIGIAYVFGLIGAGIYLAVFFLVRGTLNREASKSRITPD